MDSISMNVVEKAKMFIYEENLVSFFLIILFIQYISLYFEKESSAIIFQPVIVGAIYTYINTEVKNGMYILLMSGLIASVVPFLLWKLFSKFIPHIALNTASAFACILIMDLLNCFSTSAIGYAFSSTVLIPQIGDGFLFSYLLAAMFAIVFIEIYDHIIASKFIHKKLGSSIHAIPSTKPKFISNTDPQSAA